ncbi:MAG: PIN domain-containing protein [Oscillospiraceae bacterium]|nr:PIN domain-containing protein [Oscillospiraceae bacterium]
MKTYVLDACALIAMLNEENGKEMVKNVLVDAMTGKAVVIMNKLNLLEVYYDIIRKCGKTSADDMVKTIKDSPIRIKSVITDDVFTEAGRLKASYKISIADSIALAETIVLNGSLLTSDHHEFDVIEKSENISIEWIR